MARDCRCLRATCNPLLVLQTGLVAASGRAAARYLHSWQACLLFNLLSTGQPCRYLTTSRQPTLSALCICGDNLRPSH